MYDAKTARVGPSAICAGRNSSIDCNHYSCIQPVRTEYAAVVSLVSISQQNRYYSLPNTAQP